MKYLNLQELPSLELGMLSTVLGLILPPLCKDLQRTSQQRVVQILTQVQEGNRK